MCGIAGGWWKQEPINIKDRLQYSLSKMKNRGPDDEGSEYFRSQFGMVALGHRRLSILDLSPAGHQPMHTADGHFSIVFNGEIYNYRELRIELESLGFEFTSNSDTEVLLNAWVQWREKCLDRLQGMFAFVVYDHRNQTLVAVRDAFGIKPFFYYIDDDRFIFASQQDALIILRGDPVEADWQRGYDYLVHRDYDSQERTFIRGVKHLMPGCWFKVNLESGRTTEPEFWWQPVIKQTSKLTFSQAAETVREKFLENIRLHLRSDVPIGAALSGGIDSSAVVCAMRYIEPELPINTFSFIAKGSELSEEHWVDRINDFTGANAHKFTVTGEELGRDVDAILQAQGEPFGSTSMYAQYRVFQHAREHGVVVILDGQGADELLAGYNGQPGQRLLSLLEQCKLISALKFSVKWNRWQIRNYKPSWMHLGRILLPDTSYAMARKLLGRNFQPPWLKTKLLRDAGINFNENRYTLKRDGRGRRVIEQMANSLQFRGLPALLRHGDRSSMKFSVESRVPFLTIPMAELLYSLPEEYLISNTGETKHIFRAAMRGIVPNDVLDRRDKIGFETPERDWLFAISAQLRQWLQSSSHIPFINNQELIKAFDSVVESKQNFSEPLWRWINYVRWYDNVILCRPTCND